jgi:hypothetical protein
MSFIANVMSLLSLHTALILKTRPSPGKYSKTIKISEFSFIMHPVIFLFSHWTWSHLQT